MTIPIESAASSESAAGPGSASQEASRQIPSPRDAAPAWLSEYLQEYWNGHSDDTPVAAGVLVNHLLVEHQGLTGPYLDVRLDAAVAGWGLARSVREHLRLVRDRWDDAVSPIITTRRVVLGLALDPELGRPLLGTGAVESIVRLWSPQDTQGSDPTLPPWDMLSDAGRLLAEGQPLLAGAFGAPSEWNGAKPVELPGAASALAFAPGGDRVAVLCGEDVWQVTRTGSIERLGVAPPDTRGLGWGRHGVVTQSLGSSGDLTVSDLAAGPASVARTSVMSATLSGDGSRVWLLEGGRLSVLRVGDTEPQDLATASGRVVAVDHGGVLGLADLPAGPALVSLEPGAAGMDAGTPAQPLPNSPATLLGYVPADPTGTSPVVAVGRVAGRFGRARTGQQGGVVVEVLPDTRVARLATGPGPVTALAAGPGGLLAVAAGGALRVWSLGTAPVVEVRAQYAPDRASGPQDLLDADSDARGLAALIASADLVPPLAVGLFGAWGSGKSFLLDRIKEFVETFTRAGRTEGYLEHVPVVTFNAWHYAETNLWAALVNDVLLAIRKECSPAWDADEKVRVAEQALAEARLRVRRRRRTGLLAVAAVAVVVLAGVVLWRTGFVQWVWALGLVTAALGVADSMRKTASWLKDVGPLFSAIGSVWGARRGLARAQLGADLARQDQPSEVTEAEELGGTIRKLVEDPEYRDLLGLVTRTRQRFQSLDDAVRAARKDGAASLQLERVVVMIDDLDRCPPEKVVSVLEAVHLLFDFELFVVLLAVDTRWLEQSLRIRYRKLLGAHHGASPSDYLEKIIQIPLQVLPLDDPMIRRMLTGLTGAAAPEPAAAPLPATADHAGAAPSAPAGERARREATKPRIQRSLAQVLTITPSDAAAMAAVVGLIGTTPRTVKRFVNTYRLLKARATDLSSFAERRDGVADDQIVAFLLALVTGRPGFTPLLTYLANGGPQATVRSLVQAMAPDDGTPPEPGVTQLLAWLDSRPALAGASAPRCAGWASEVRRFTFLPPSQ